MESAFYGVAAIYGEDVSNRHPNTKCLICKDILWDVSLVARGLPANVSFEMHNKYSLADCSR